MHAVARVLALFVMAGAWFGWEYLEPPTTPPAPVSAAVAVDPGGYAYIGPPTISRDVYAGVFCKQNGSNSAICQQAPAMYDAVVAAGADPALELAHAGNESSYGTGGVGMPPWHNLHGIHGHSGGLGTPFVNSAPGDEDMQQYDSYPDAVADWVWLIRDGGLYYPERNDPESVLAIYCDCGGEGGKAAYVDRMKAQIDGWRAEYGEEETQPVFLHKCPVTDTMAVSASFSSTGSQFWAGQAGGMHNGTDFSGNPGEPVYAPFDFTVEDIQYYGDSGRIGWYVQGRFADGYLFYAGHLGQTFVQVGQAVAACTQIGTIGEVFHTHVKINPPGSPEPCETTGCEDFEQYYATH